MARDLVINAHKNPHITAKELQKRVANTGLVQDNNTTYCKQQRPTWQNCQREGPQYKVPEVWKKAKWNILAMLEKGELCLLKQIHSQNNIQSE